MKAIIFVLVLAFVALAQQINYTWGLKKTSGDAWSGDGITYIDTTTGTTNDIIVVLDDYFLNDFNPAIYDSATALASSDYFYLGTFYSYWDNQGAASTTDSMKYTIKAYPGIFTTDTKAISGVKYGTAITLETISRIADYYTASNVYLSTTLGKAIPPDVIKIELAPTGDIDTDDSTKVNWRFAYPAIHQVYKERK